MKKNIITIVLVVLTLFSCTDNQKARSWGGKETITLEPNEKLINITWKADDMWLLTEDTVSHTTYFRESSSFGLMEGQITINKHIPDSLYQRPLLNGGDIQKSLDSL